MRRSFFVALTVLLISGTAHADLKQQEMAAYEQLQDLMPACEKLVIDGRADDAEQKLLAAFPAQTRTAAQSLLLGNLLFKQDFKTAYTLHKDAVTRLPDESDAQLEWAMEQHRAGEYAGAADSYSIVSQADPANALVYGLQAECLLRTGKIDEAIKVWGKSERARKGTLEDLESYVCDVNGHLHPDWDRAELMKKTRAGDIVAAEQLICLDTAFPQDWWNKSPRAKYLQRDLQVLKQTKFVDQSRLVELNCAAECGIILASDTGGDANEVLTRYGFLLDPAATLPRAGWAASIMMNAAVTSKAISEADAKQKWGPALLAAAKKSRDAELINAAAHYFLETPTLLELDQLGWDSTRDARFAVSLLLGKDAKGELKAGDPLLTKALKQFPENSMVVYYAVVVSNRAKLPMHDLLLQAIKAEYTEFSFQHGLSHRRGSQALRAYFKLLGTTPGN